MPDSHRLSFHEIHSELRLTQPLVRKEHANAAESKTHQNTPLAAAIEAAAEGFKDLKGDEIAIITSARQTNEELLLIKKIQEALGTDNLVLIARFGESDGKLISADRNPNTTGAKLVLGNDNIFDKFDSVREGITSGKIKGLLVLGEDLTESGYSADELAKLQHLVVIHTLSNATAGRAHVVLPSASFAEKRGSMVNVTGRLQRLNRAILPPGEASPDWEILANLLTSIDANAVQPQSIQDVFKILAAEVSAFAELSLQKIGDLGTPVTETGVTIPLLEKERQRIERREIVG